ncbi:DUF416 family protein [Mucilaginibacter sp. 22184]|uniref:DUF416 family protein n=1 Tax=Mucilaginibacter sp. 22184 TaxID=3453887 RepID=UPI003F848AA7
MDIYRKEIEVDLIKLSHTGRLLFAVLTSERLYPNYVLFQNQNGWGNNEVLQQAIVLIYESILHPDKMDLRFIEDAISEVDLITPDTEQFPGILTSFVLDACTSVYSTLSYLLDHKLDNIIDVATYARDTVDMYIQERDDMGYQDPDFEIKIANDRFMVAEKKRQKDLAISLSKMSDAEMVSSINILRDQTPIVDFSLLPY